MGKDNDFKGCSDGDYSTYVYKYAFVTQFNYTFNNLPGNLKKLASRNENSTLQPIISDV